MQLQRTQAPAARCQRKVQAFQPGRVLQTRAARDSCSTSDNAGFSGWMDKALFSVATAGAITLTSLSLAFAPIAEAKLTAGDPIKNAQAILRNALPVENKPIRQLQRELESISDSLRIPGSKSLGPVARAVRNAQDILKKQRNDIVNAFAPEKKEAGLAALASLEQSLSEFNALIEAKDKQEVPIKQREALAYVGKAEEAMVKGFPFTIPPEYSNLPQLLGRATLEMRVTQNQSAEGGVSDVVMTIVADGYNAPVSAGAFVDLVQRKFYDGMEIQRADGFVVQTGDPDGPADGFVDADGKVRKVPLEIRVFGEKEPIYEFSLEDLGRVNEQPVLPFNAYGTMAWARSEFDNNSASSQIFFLLKESELTPSGSNLLDGRFAVFGYIVQGQDALANMKVGDKIQYIKVTEGAEFLKNGP